jgi:hypothetical protein
MKKIEITTGNHEDMILISTFLIRNGFTPAYKTKASVNGNGDKFHAGWRDINRGDMAWTANEPIPRDLLENNFVLPETVRLCHFPEHPEVGVAIASDITGETIDSSPFISKRGEPGVVFDFGNGETYTQS